MTLKIDQKLWTQPWWVHYGAALVISIAGLSLRSYIAPVLGPQAPYFSSVFPVIISAYFGGFGPGILASAIGMITSAYLFVQPAKLAPGVMQSELLIFSIGAIVCISICAVSGRLRASILNNGRLLEKISRDSKQVTDVLDRLTDVFYSVDANWTVVQTNPAFETAVGDKSPMLGKHLWKEFPGQEETNLYLMLFKVMQDRLPQEIEMEHTEVSKWFRVHAFPTEFGISVFNHEITERKQLEKVRERMLADERVARSAAEEAGQAKDEFLAVLSHELRTPMTSLLGWAELLASEKKGSPRLSQGLDQIEQSARKQLKMIEELLDVGSINAGKMRVEMELLDLGQTVEEAIYFHRPAAEAKSITLEFSRDHPQLIVRGDSARLHQVIGNIISNAIKFTPKLGKVEMCVYLDESTACLEVVDNGEGISAEVLPYIFDRFRQANSSTSRTHGGLGLGLSISQQLIQLHGGSMGAFSAGLGQGSKFVVRLPVASVKSLRSSPSKSTPDYEDLEGVRTLVVEDDAATRALLTRIIVEQKGVVLAAEDAITALKLITDFHPTVILSDIGLPEIDGYGFMQRVRARADEWSKTPSIALTAFAREVDRKAALDAGFNAFHTKPVNTTALLKTLRELSDLSKSSLSSP